MALGLVVLVGLVYANAVNHPFLYDDSMLVVKNPEIRSLDNFPQYLGFDEEGFTLRTRWTRLVTHALEYKAVGLWAPLYHLDNIILHALAALFVFAFVTSLSRDRLLGWWSAALFAVHPINTEVVAHVSGRRGLLAALFSIGALWLLMRYVRSGGWWRVALGVVCLYLGVFSKELALLAPIAFVLAAVYARFYSTQGDADASRASSGWVDAIKGFLVERKILVGGLAALTAGFAFAILRFGRGMGGGLAGSPSFYDITDNSLGLLDHLRLAGFGLRMLILPLSQTHDYSYDAFGFVSGGFNAMYWVDILVLAAAGVATFFGLRAKNWIGFAGLWFCIFFLPHMGIIPWHEIFAERFLYMASIGVCVGVASILVRLIRSESTAQFAKIAGVVVLLLLGTGTFLRNGVWKSDKALWSSAVEAYPRAAKAHKALADFYVNHEQRTDLATRHYDEAIAILPIYRDAYIGRAMVLVARNKFGDALDSLDKTLEMWPDEPKALNLKGYVKYTLGDVDAAKALYEAAVEADPKFVRGYNNLAQIYAEENDLDTAIQMYEKAIELDPSFYTALLNLAQIYRHGLEDESMAMWYEERAEAVR
ncbi:MAG: tetratricopeptide repeat protein [bacterium]|nr:tetratricopeptide repeat protein [bacterium]